MRTSDFNRTWLSPKKPPSRGVVCVLFSKGAVFTVKRVLFGYYHIGKFNAKRNFS